MPQRRGRSRASGPPSSSGRGALLMQNMIRCVFFSGVMVGFAGATIPAHRWWLFAWFLGVAALFAYGAWKELRKIPKLP
jgi:hypothetical protein